MGVSFKISICFTKIQQGLFALVKEKKWCHVKNGGATMP